jgi:hypothetical protein
MTTPSFFLFFFFSGKTFFCNYIKSQDMKLAYLMAYVISYYLNRLKDVLVLTLYIPLNASTLNHELDFYHFSLSRYDPIFCCPSRSLASSKSNIYIYIYIYIYIFFWVRERKTSLSRIMQ